MLDVEELEGLQLDNGDVLLQFVVGRREHNRRHHLQIVKLFAVVDDDVEEVGVDLEFKTGACRVCLELLVDIDTH